MSTKDAKNDADFKIPTEQNSVPKFGARHVQAILMFLYLTLTVVSRSTMSLAIVAMTDSSASKNPNVPTYAWKNSSYILSCFYWTYIILQPFAGLIFKRYGLKWVLMGTMGLNTIIFTLIPFSAFYLGSKGVMACRMIQGVLQGFTYPACQTVLGLWAPASERSFLSVLVYSGANVGLTLALLVTGYISSSWYGWPVAFYLFGICGMIWCVFWVAFGFDRPSKHPRINASERNYIEKSLEHEEENEADLIKTLPLKAIFTSLPFWALVVGNAGNAWGLAFIDLQIPTYIRRVLNFDINSSGLIAASPQITQLLISLLFAPVSDYIVRRNYVSLTNRRRLFQFLGSILPSAALLWLAFISNSQGTLAIVLLNTIIGTNALLLYGSVINHVDLAPRYAGVLLSFENTMSQITSLSAPVVVQYIVTDLSDIHLWRYVFIILAVITSGTAIFFIIFGSGKVQWWNFGKYAPKDKTQNSLNEKNKTEKV